MPIADVCSRKVAVIDRKSKVTDAARVMREAHVGDVIVCAGKERRPVGILTDRDIVVGLVAMGIAPESVQVEDVMTPTLVTVTEEQGIYDTIQLMERYGVSRLPVVTANGVLCGIVSSTDLLELLSREIGSLSRLSERQKNREKEVRL